MALKQFALYLLKKYWKYSIRYKIGFYNEEASDDQENSFTLTK